MKCPHCQKPSFALETRTQSQWVRRRRECLNGHRFTTQETVVEQPAKKGK